ncbi:hypothetical protein VTN31DRAFT_4923 [Thermomyces dupontii]|uniref:uncharacterized protein n=1 Tax=Talaromyces thermophilus TaxID=28565 RepID=UPI0037426578
MLSAPIVLAVSIGCSVLFVVSAVVAMVVWWRVRNDRLSLAMANAQLSQMPMLEQGTANVKSSVDSSLATYHPYNGPREWAPLGSQETMQGLPSHAKSQRPAQQAPPSPPPARESERGELEKGEKLGPIRKAFSKSLSERLPIGKAYRRVVPLSPLDTVIDNATAKSSAMFPDAREKEPKSAVEGFSELPTEITPRTTPERDANGAVQSRAPEPRPGSTAWPYSRPDFPTVSGSTSTISDRPLSRTYNGGIATQSPGSAPDYPMPPPPAAAVAHGRSFQAVRDDSLMRLSSLSLETANSSILDEGVQGSPTDGEIRHSPALPPCPTFNPFSPQDIVIGGNVASSSNASHQRSHSEQSSSSVSHLIYVSANSYRLDWGSQVPRRSHTTRESGHPPDWKGQLPRRSETVLSPSSSRGSLRFENSRPVSGASISSSRGFHSSSTAIMHIPHNRQQADAQGQLLQQRYSMYETRETAASHHQFLPDNRPRSVLEQSPGRLQRSPVKGTLPSAMKSAQGMRKGHKRQNCVRISIHPPVTFGGRVFSPMMEEPEEVVAEMGDEAKSTKFRKADEQQPLRNHSGNSPSNKSKNSQAWSPSKYSHHSSAGSVRESPSSHIGSPDRGSRLPRANSSRKRSYTGTTSVDDVFVSREIQDGDSQLTVSPLQLTPNEERSQPRTPSPDKRGYICKLPPSDGFAGSSSHLPANASTTSPRRSTVRGPRDQRQKHQGSISSADSTLETQTSYTVSPSARHSAGSTGPISTTGSPVRRQSKNVSPTRSKAVRASITQLRRMNSDPRDEDSRQYRRMGMSSSTSTLGDGEAAPTPPTRRHTSIVTSSGRVSIWENARDDDRAMKSPRRKKAFSVLERIDSEGDVGSSVSNRNGFSNDGGAAEQHAGNENPAESGQAPSLAITPRKNLNAAGRGLGTSTPGSLYDRDGFLKE